MINVQRSLWASAIAFASNLTVLSLLSSLVGPFLANSTSAQMVTQAIFVLVTFGSTFFAVRWYFKGATHKNPTTGLVMGGIVALSSLLVTIVQFTPGILYQGGNLSFITTSFMQPQFWIVIAVTLAAGAAAGMMKRSK